MEFHIEQTLSIPVERYVHWTATFTKLLQLLLLLPADDNTRARVCSVLTALASLCLARKWSYLGPVLPKVAAKFEWSTVTKVCGGMRPHPKFSATPQQCWHL